MHAPRGTVLVMQPMILDIREKVVPRFFLLSLCVTVMRLRNFRYARWPIMVTFKAPSVGTASTSFRGTASWVCWCLVQEPFASVPCYFLVHVV